MIRKQINSFIYVKHKDGSESKLGTSQYLKYNSKSTDVFDFRDFNKMLNKPKVIQKNFKLLQKMLNNPNKKVTILTKKTYFLSENSSKTNLVWKYML